eukprot:1157067-Pelagomonas_calceolata.AAC.4
MAVQAKQPGESWEHETFQAPWKNNTLASDHFDAFMGKTNPSAGKCTSTRPISPTVWLLSISVHATLFPGRVTAPQPRIRLSSFTTEHERTGTVGQAEKLPDCCWGAAAEEGGFAFACVESVVRASEETLGVPVQNDHTGDRTSAFPEIQCLDQSAQMLYILRCIVPESVQKSKRNGRGCLGCARSASAHVEPVRQQWEVIKGYKECSDRPSSQPPFAPSLTSCQAWTELSSPARMMKECAWRWPWALGAARLIITTIICSNMRCTIGTPNKPAFATFSLKTFTYMCLLMLEVNSVTIVLHPSLQQQEPGLDPGGNLRVRVSSLGLLLLKADTIQLNRCSKDVAVSVWTRLSTHRGLHGLATSTRETGVLSGVHQMHQLQSGLAATY